jgi:hypothetical protein
MPYLPSHFRRDFAAAARLIFRLRHFDFADTPPLSRHYFHIFCFAAIDELRHAELMMSRHG